MTITQLKYVLAVAKYQNFTLAAEKSFVTQPTLSMQVQKLEDELDIQIFDRSKKPIELTNIGHKIIQQARNIINESNRMNDVVDQEKGIIAGPFKIGIIATVMPTLLPMFLNTFLKKYPLLEVTIEELTTEQVLKKIKDGNLDAGIAATPLDVDYLVERPLYYEPFVAYIPGNHQLSSKENIKVEDIDPDDVLLLQDGHCFRNQVLTLCRTSANKSSSNIKLQSGSFETIIKLTQEGMGMTLLPYLHTLGLNEKDQNFLHNFEAPSPAREISLIYNKNELKLHIIEALRSLIASVIRGAIAFNNVQIIDPKKKSFATESGSIAK